MARQCQRASGDHLLRPDLFVKLQSRAPITITQQINGQPIARLIIIPRFILTLSSVREACNCTTRWNRMVTHIALATVGTWRVAGDFHSETGCIPTYSFVTAPCIASAYAPVGCKRPRPALGISTAGDFDDLLRLYLSGNRMHYYPTAVSKTVYIQSRSALAKGVKLATIGRPNLRFCVVDAAYPNPVPR